MLGLRLFSIYQWQLSFECKFSVYSAFTLMRGSALRSVLEANAEVNGIGENSHPYPSEILVPIYVPLQIYHYVCPGIRCAKFD